MQLAKLTSKGQITIPKEIREKLKLKEGDKVFFVEENGKIYFENSSQIALSKIQNEMLDYAPGKEFQSEQDIVDFIKTIRKDNIR